MSVTDYKCPKCGGSNFKWWKLPHPLILHWILNPGLVFNEIILGQRLPKVQLICKDCECALLDRVYIPCPSCHSMHWGRLWSGKRGFGNWRGIACPACGAPIPCVWNLFSLLLLALTSPIWVLPYYLHFRSRPLKPIYESRDGTPPKPSAITKKTWVVMGAMFGGFMWVGMSLIFFLDKGRISLVNMLPAGAFSGLAFGFFMWFFLGRKRQGTDRGKQDGPVNRIH
jgi:hypothetical protein